MYITRDIIKVVMNDLGIGYLCNPQYSIDKLTEVIRLFLSSNIGYCMLSNDFYRIEKYKEAKELVVKLGIMI